MAILDSLPTYVTSIPGSIVNHGRVISVLRPELYKYPVGVLSNPHQTLLPLPPNCDGISTNPFELNNVL